MLFQQDMIRFLCNLFQNPAQQVIAGIGIPGLFTGLKAYALFFYGIQDGLVAYIFPEQPLVVLPDIISESAGMVHHLLKGDLSGIRNIRVIF